MMQKIVTQLQDVIQEMCKQEDQVLCAQSTTHVQLSGQVTGQVTVASNILQKYRRSKCQRIASQYLFDNRGKILSVWASHEHVPLVRCTAGACL